MKQIVLSMQGRLRLLSGRTSAGTVARERLLDFEQEVERAAIVDDDHGLVNLRALLSTEGDQR